MFVQILVFQKMARGWAPPSSKFPLSHTQLFPVAPSPISLYEKVLRSSWFDDQPRDHHYMCVRCWKQTKNYLTQRSFPAVNLQACHKWEEGVLLNLCFAVLILKSEQLGCCQHWANYWQLVENTEPCCRRNRQDTPFLTLFFFFWVQSSLAGALIPLQPFFGFMKYSTVQHGRLAVCVSKDCFSLSRLSWAYRHTGPSLDYFCRNHCVL